MSVSDEVEELPLFWCVDSCKTNSVLFLIGIENCDRVAVGNMDNLAFDGFSKRWDGGKKKDRR